VPLLEIVVVSQQCVGGRSRGSEAFIVSKGGAASGADLGSSSNHSNEARCYS